MDDETKVDVTNLDDVGEHYGLGHHASKSRSGGASKFFEEQEREHRRLQTEEMARQGISDPTKVRPTNHGAYDVDDGHDRRKAADQEYLGDSIENLAGSNRRVHAGGGGGNKTQFREEPIFDTCPTLQQQLRQSSRQAQSDRPDPRRHR